MPRYFFHVLNDIDARDEEGQELDNLAMAHLKAVDFARDLAATSVQQGRLNLTHRIDVENEAGEVLVTVTFDEAVEIVSPVP
jgi:hypothetical protein